MKCPAWSLMTLALLLSGAGHVAAAVLYTQPWDHVGGGWASQHDTTVGGGGMIGPLTMTSPLKRPQS